MFPAPDSGSVDLEVAVFECVSVRRFDCREAETISVSALGEQAMELEDLEGNVIASYEA